MMTYTDLKNAFLDGTQNTGSIDTNLLAYFQRSLDTRYQLVLAQISNQTTQVQRTATTTAGQAFYHYPAGIVQVETATITVGSIAYPLTFINSQMNWDKINEFLITSTAIPQFIFPRRDDFGVWPAPQAQYTITLNYNMRDRKLTQDDYTTGTVSVSTNSQLVTGISAAFTQSMVGQWFQIPSDGYWYRVSDYLGPTQINIETSWEGYSLTGQNYRIGQMPEIPDEAHPLLYRGCISDFYSEVRGDVEKSTWFNNLFWTGDGQNSDRTGENVMGGLIGIKKQYQARGNNKLVHRMAGYRLRDSKLWATTIQ